MSRNIKIALGAIVVIVIAAVSLLTLRSDSIATVTQDQIKLIRAGKLDEAYSLTSKTFQADTSLDRFKEFVKQYDVFGDNKNLEITEQKENGDNAYLKGTITSNDGGQMIIEYIVLKENGQWKIEALRLTPINAPPAPTT